MRIPHLFHSFISYYPLTYSFKTRFKKFYQIRVDSLFYVIVDHLPIDEARGVYNNISITNFSANVKRNFNYLVAI